MTTITLLGATGSIGESALKVIEAAGFQVYGVSAHRNVKALATLAKKFNVSKAVIADKSLYAELKSLLEGTAIEVAAGRNELTALAREPVDVLLAAITGIAGLPSVFAAAATQKKLALANKEAVVCGGTLLMACAAQSGCQILPIDSEHHALSRLLESARKVRTITLTASGGAFRDMPLAQMKNITPAQATKHPVWSMGDKISIDSATMMNKVLELIEAHYLFNLAPEQLTMLQHRESIIHGLVEEASGAQLALLGLPDMRLAIADILGAQEIDLPRLDLAQLGALHFCAIDPKRFPAAQLATPVLQAGQGAAIVLNAANEVLVQAFLEGKLAYLSIATGVENVLEKMVGEVVPPHNLDDIFALDDRARTATKEIMEIYD